MSSSAVSVVEQISAAMSLATLEHRVIATNIANRDTQGYQRLKLQFERAMDEAGEARIAPDHSAAEVTLEQDLVALSSNSMQYQAMSRVLNRYFSILSVIANYNRG